VNSTSQLDLHPDADSLNAFAEQALAAPEREQVLAHLAGCSRCRQVIFLAQQAAAEAEVPAWLPAARSTSQPGAWFWSWRFAWIPATAMAAALALVVTFHPWHTAPAPKMAKVTPQSEAAIPEPAPQEQANAGAVQKVAPAHTASDNATLVAPRRPTLTHVPTLTHAQAPAPPADFDEIMPSTGETNASPGLGLFSRQPESAVQYKPEPGVAAWPQERQRTTGASSASANTSQVSQKSMRAEAYSAHASRPAAVASAGPRLAQQSQPAPAASFDSATQQQFGGSSIFRKVNPPKLPSGMAVVSRATAQRLMLEIDRAGALFLSYDSGEHWQPVPQQWTGRAIEVRAKTTLSGNTAPEMKFELKNETGSTWASADGKTWTAQ